MRKIPHLRRCGLAFSEAAPPYLRHKHPVTERLPPPPPRPSPLRPPNEVEEGHLHFRALLLSARRTRPHLQTATATVEIGNGLRDRRERARWPGWAAPPQPPLRPCRRDRRIARGARWAHSRAGRLRRLEKACSSATTEAQAARVRVIPIRAIADAGPGPRRRRNHMRAVLEGRLGLLHIRTLTSAPFLIP